MIATVFGHTHENKVTAFPKPGGGGFWGIESPSHIDWPLQSRLIEVMDNRDGTLSIFGTVLDVDAPVRAPAPGTSAAGFGVPELASVARTLAYNDSQAGGLATGNGKGDGVRADRNVELVVGDPRRSTGGGGRCAARAAGCAGRRSAGRRSAEGAPPTAAGSPGRPSAARAGRSTASAWSAAARSASAIPRAPTARGCPAAPAGG